MGKKKISDLTPDEQEAQRQKWREEKQTERAAKKRQAYVPTPYEWMDEFAETEHAKTLSTYTKQFLNKVVEELGRELGEPQRDAAGNVIGWSYDEEFTVGAVAATLLSLKKNWVKEVRDPNGEMIGGLFIDDCNFASDLIESVHRYGLKKSPTFASSFHDLLKMLNKRYGQHSQESAVVRAELAGTYVPPQPKPELKPDLRIPDVS